VKIHYLNPETKEASIVCLEQLLLDPFDDDREKVYGAMKQVIEFENNRLGGIDRNCNPKVISLELIISGLNNNEIPLSEENKEKMIGLLKNIQANPDYLQIMDFRDMLINEKPYHLTRFVMWAGEEVHLFEISLNSKIRDRFQQNDWVENICNDKSITAEKRTKLYMEKYNLGYRSIIRSRGGKDSHTAKAIYDWFKDDLKLELPKSLAKGEKLSFSSLILAEKTTHIGIITPAFCAAIGESYQKLTAPFDKSTESQKFKLELELDEYINQRQVEGESELMKNLRKLFNREQFGMTSKIGVAKDLLEAIQDKKEFQLTDITYQVLTDGRVKDIVSQYIGKNILPVNLEQAIVNNNLKLVVNSSKEPSKNLNPLSGNDKKFSRFSKLDELSKTKNSSDESTELHNEDETMQQNIEFIKSSMIQLCENYKNNKIFFSNTHEKVANQFEEKMHEICNSKTLTQKMKMISILTLAEYLFLYLKNNKSKKFFQALSNFMVSNNLLHLIKIDCRKDNTNDFAKVSDFLLSSENKPIYIDLSDSDVLHDTYVNEITEKFANPNRNNLSISL
jgi:hypothetical protein